MTPQLTQIQTLIAEIDGVLSKASPRLPWVMSGDVDHQRRILEQTRDYLVSLQQQMAVSAQGQSSISEFAAPLPRGGYSQPYAAESAQQVLQAVLQEMSYLRANLLQPMRTEMEILQQQRQSLLQEIRHLEAQRQQAAIPPSAVNPQQLDDFLQALMGRMQETLPTQIAQLVANTQFLVQTSEVSALPGSHPQLLAEASLPPLSPAERLAQMQALQAQSDQLALKLDATLRVFFESLHNNVQSYQESLNNGLTKMHTLGQQGEAMFAALINRLAQQLGREASTYLQSSVETSDWAAANRPLNQNGTPIADPPLTTLLPPDLDFPESELDADISEDQIDQLLDELRSDALRDSTPDRPLTTPSADRSLPVTLPAEADLSDLDLLNLELEEMDLDADTSDQNFLIYGDDDDLTFLQTDEPEQITQFQVDDVDLTFLQVDEEFTELQVDFDWNQTPVSPEPPDLNSAVDLLNQLSLEDPQSPSASSASPTLEQTAVPEAEEADFDELDQFYESLFGEEALPAEEPAPVHATQTETVRAIADVFPIEAGEEQTLEEQLFGNLEDFALGEADEAEPDRPDQTGLDSLGQEAEVTPANIAEVRADRSDRGSDELTLEGFLFDEPPAASGPAAPSDSEFEVLFDWAESEPDLIEGVVPASTTDAPEEDVITSLADLSRLAAAPGFQTETTEVSAAEEFEAASPDEDLLVTEALTVETRIALEVGDDTLELLQQDLSHFESGDWQADAGDTLEAGFFEFEPEAIAPPPIAFEIGSSATNPSETAVPEIAGPAAPGSEVMAPEAIAPEDRAQLLPSESPTPAVSAAEVVPAGGIPPFQVNTTSDGDDLTWLLEPPRENAAPLPPAMLGEGIDLFPEEPASVPQDSALQPSAAQSPLSASTGVNAALSEDFLAALLGDVPNTADILPPSPPAFTVDVTATVTPASPTETPEAPASQEDLNLEEGFTLGDYQSVLAAPADQSPVPAEPSTPPSFDLFGDFSEIETMLGLSTSASREDLSSENDQSITGPSADSSPIPPPEPSPASSNFDLFSSIGEIGEIEEMLGLRTPTSQTERQPEANQAATGTPVTNPSAPPLAVDLDLFGEFASEPEEQPLTAREDLTLEDYQAVMGVSAATPPSPPEPSPALNLDLFSEDLFGEVGGGSGQPLTAREDLTLEDYQAVMGASGVTPPVAPLQTPQKSGFPSGSQADRPTDLPDPDLSTSTLRDDLIPGIYQSSTDQSSTRATESAPSTPTPAVPQSEDTLELSSDLLADLPSFSPTTVSPDADIDPEVERIMEGLFSPEAIAQASETVPDMTLENWVPEFPVADAATESAAPLPQASSTADAFTLEGLDNLFEALPAIETQPAEAPAKPAELPPTASATSPGTTPPLPEPEELTLDALFNGDFSGDFGSQASLDLYEQFPLTDSAQKKSP